MDESIFERLGRVTKERDAAVAEAKELKEALHDAWTDIAQQNHKSRQQIRPEPSRLEIAAMVLQGMTACSHLWGDPENTALRKADALIKAAREAQ